MRRRERLCRQMIMLGLFLVEGLLIWLLIRRDLPVTSVDWLGAYSVESDEFRAMDFGDGVLAKTHDLAEEWQVEVYSILAAQLAVKSAEGAGKSPSGAGNGSYGEPVKEDKLLDYPGFKQLAGQLQQEKPVEWTKLVNGYRTILADVRYFPVAVSGERTGEESLPGLSYENGWGDARTYGGDRLHEGTDIMDNENVRGSFPIVSMTDGVIEHIGWLEQGGYRIGIRSPHGAYFYYAHLAVYAENFQVGQRVSAGQVIGLMGDTGYSTVEGTVGNFPVHLHLGIYLETDHYDELSVNPYYILKYLENSTVSYTKDTCLWYSFRERSVETDYGDTIMAGNAGPLRSCCPGTDR